MRQFMERPLYVRDCADYMGVSPQKIRDAITVGVPYRGTVVKLDAEILPNTRRSTYRIYTDAFRDFLIAIDWKHLPGRPAPHAVPHAKGA